MDHALHDAVQVLQQHDITATVESGSGLSLRSSRWTGDRRVEVRVRAVAPTPSMVRLDRLRQTARPAGEVADAVLYLVPRMTASLRAAAEAGDRIDAIATLEQVAILDGTEFRAPVVPVQPRPWSRRRPWVRWALMRALVRSAVPRTQQQLALECGASQVAISKALQALGPQVVRSRAGWQAIDPQTLWDRFVAEYPGPGGLVTFWYGITAPARQAAEAVEIAAGAGVEVLVSGDVAADRWAPWRRPEVAVLYARQGLALAAGPFAESDPVAATLRVVVPADPTIWPSTAAWRQDDTAAGLADPLVTAWEVLQSTGTDTVEAAKTVRDRLLGDVR